MKCYFCTEETEHFCICRSKSSVVCEKHASYHTIENPFSSHWFDKIDYYPNDQEKSQLTEAITKNISTLETIKENKIKEKYQEIGEILGELKILLEKADEDISNLNYLSKQVISSKSFSKIENFPIVSLFNSSYEEVIKILADNGWLNFQNFISKINPKYTCNETQTEDLDQKPLFYFPIFEPPKVQLQSNDVSIPYRAPLVSLKSNVVWSKLTEDGNFTPYCKDDNDIIESAYQNGDPFTYIDDSNIINLTYPIFEVQRTKSLITMVLRNNRKDTFDAIAKFESWYFKGDKGWEAMAPDTSRMAEWALQNDYNEALIQSKNKKSYRLDLKNMKQINLKTNSKRDIRRGYEPNIVEEVKNDIKLTGLQSKRFTSSKSPIQIKRRSSWNSDYD